MNPNSRTARSAAPVRASFGVGTSLAGLLLLSGIVLVAPGCIFGGPSCDHHTGCHGNQVAICYPSSDGDGPDHEEIDFDCPGGTTCTDRKGMFPVCVVGKGQACDTLGDVQCVDGVPAVCVALQDKTQVFASDHNTTRYAACGAGQSCQLASSEGPTCVSAAMRPCGEEDSEDCSDGIPSICIKLADGSLVWTASYQSSYDQSGSGDGKCPSGSTCSKVGKTTACLVNGPVACKRSASPTCLSKNSLSTCVVADDGTTVEGAVVCEACNVVDGQGDCSNE